MQKYLIAALMAGCAMPAQAVQIRWIGWADVTEDIYGEGGSLISIYRGKHEFYVVGNDWSHLAVGGAPGMVPGPSVMVAEAVGKSISIAYPPIYFAPFGFYVTFDRNVSLSDLGDAKFVSGAYYSSFCGRGTPTNCSIWNGAIYGLSVPEPATWAMMIGGFAMVGAAMRRRKTTVSFA